MSAPRPRTRAVAIAAAAALAVFTVWVLSGWPQGLARKAIGDLTLIVVSVVALVSSVVTARATRGRVRKGWLTMSIALVMWNAAQVLWTYEELLARAAPFPSPADAYFLAFSATAVLAMVLFRNRDGGQLRGLILLDGLIVAGSLFIVSWLLIMGQLAQTASATRLEFVLALAYPVFDLVLVTVSAAVLVGSPSSQRLPMTVLTAGLVCLAVADSGFAYLAVQGRYASGSLVDIGWVAGMLLLSVAAAAGREAPTDETGEAQLPGWASVVLPYAPLMLAAGVLAARPPHSVPLAPVLVTGLLLVVIVLVRQFLAVQLSRRLLASVAEQALRDPLTGLGNRALFGDRLAHALDLRARSGATVGVLILDLDDFKMVNDTMGHAAGDELLKQAGRRILDAVGVGDTVARLGGDEFAVIIEGDADLLDRTVRRVTGGFDEPVSVDERRLLIRTSVGLAVAGAGDGDVSARDLLKQADLAMYAAKRARSAVRRQDADVAAESAPEADEPLLRDLRRALEERRLSLVYQPKFHLASGAAIGVEALLRWPHPERGVMTPDEFLPIVRRHSLFEPVTRFVIDTALDDARSWWSAGLRIPVAVNLFPPSVAVAQLPDQLSAALAARGLDSEALTVEITEDVLLDDLDRTRAVLGELRERGIRVAIDDFGSGYSALWYLRDLPVDEVKLDRSFIAPIAVDPRAAAVARAVIDLAHVLLMKTVAEGVENLETANWLRRNGCDIVQGYYYSPPLTAAEVFSLPAPIAVKSS